ncbi:MAG TPA: hypothetical protein VJR47_08800 [Stellaceae bacterium]|nr:hypothetical protein [Stellaceae bacterium]
MIARRNLLLAGLCVGLASCGPPPPSSPRLPDIRFTDETPLVIEATRIDIRNLDSPGEFDHDFPVTPRQAMENWARDRLRASGQGSPARFTILRASANEKNLPTKGGISGTFTDQLSQEYDVAVEATLEILDDHGLALRSVHASASLSRSVLQSASPNDRDEARYELVKQLMASFDRQMETQIRDNFGLYLLTR